MKITRTKNTKLNIVLAILCIILTLINNFGFREKEDNSLTDDYYTYINKDILENNDLESGDKYWSLFMNAQDNVDDKVFEIVKNIVDNNEDEKIVTLYNSVINRKEDLSILDTYIKSIDNSKNIDELLYNIIKINNDLSLGILVNATVEADYNDNKEAIVNIYPMMYDYENMYPDYYTNPLYANYVGTYIKYDREIFKLYGYSDEEAKESVRKINKFYMKIAENSKSMEELSEIPNLYNIKTDEQLKEIYTNIKNLDGFLSDYNKNLKVSIVDENQAKALNEYLVYENLDTLKEYVKLQILQTYAEYGSLEYYNLMQELNNELTGTEGSGDTLEEYATDIVSIYYDTKVSQIYLNQNVSDSKVKYFENMVDDIIKEYELKLQNNEWLSEKTKKDALLKLENMKVNICYPERWSEYSDKYVISDSLLENIINMNKVVVDSTLDAVINNEDYWPLSTLTVNAYYNLKDNSINFPAALLEYEMYDENNTYYENLGSLGMVITHEITHAFDNNGALFDANGNLNNWWNEEDYSNFETLQNEVIEYYNGYKIEGKFVNGKKTVSENIADLGAVSCIVDVAKRKGATNDDLKRLFESYANLWASKATKEYTKSLMIMDVHSPDKIRVNAVLPSIDEFYNVYEISEESKMYKEDKERVKVW